MSRSGEEVGSFFSCFLGFESRLSPSRLPLLLFFRFLSRSPARFSSFRRRSRVRLLRRPPPPSCLPSRLAAPKIAIFIFCFLCPTQPSNATESSTDLRSSVYSQKFRVISTALRSHRKPNGNCNSFHSPAFLCGERTQHFRLSEIE